jgi:hypothetical protein
MLPACMRVRSRLFACSTTPACGPAPRAPRHGCCLWPSRERRTQSLPLPGQGGCCFLCAYGANTALGASTHARGPRPTSGPLSRQHCTSLHSRAPVHASSSEHRAPIFVRASRAPSSMAPTSSVRLLCPWRAPAARAACPGRTPSPSRAGRPSHAAPARRRGGAPRLPERPRPWQRLRCREPAKAKPPPVATRTRLPCASAARGPPISGFGRPLIEQTTTRQPPRSPPRQPGAPPHLSQKLHSAPFVCGAPLPRIPRSQRRPTHNVCTRGTACRGTSPGPPSG